MEKITVIGSSNTDLVVNTPRIPSAGETLMGDAFRMAGGGKGANQAVAVKKLGADMRFIAKVGDDMFGRGAIKTLQGYGIDTTYIILDSEHPSGVALITVDQNAENAISVAPGANMALRPEEVADDVIRDSEIVLLQLETPMETIESIIQRAYDFGVKVVLNPAPAAKLKDDIIAKTFLLTPNETECACLTGMPTQTDEQVESAARKLLEKGAQNVIVTLGSRGSMWVSQHGTVLVPACRVKAIDTVAAGDTFNGALCVALSEGKTMTEAMEFASKASAIAVTRHGAQPSVPSREEVDNF